MYTVPNVISEIQRVVMSKDFTSEEYTIILHCLQNLGTVKPMSKTQAKVAKYSKDIDVYNIPQPTRSVPPIITASNWTVVSDFECNYSVRTPVTTQKKEETTMDTNANTKYYLNNRLRNVGYDFENQLTKAFGLVDDDRPRTAKDLVDRITSGQYVLPKENDDSDYEPDAFHSIRWRNPELKADRVSYEKAWAKMDKAKVAVHDLIEVADPVVALKALQEFEATASTTFH